MPEQKIKQEIGQSIRPKLETEPMSNPILLPLAGACDLPTGEPLGRPSTYTAATSSFNLTVNIQDDASFCLNQYTIASGPMKGCRALILVPAGSFRLLDLPVEIRQIIYTYLITFHKPIKLKRYNGGIVQQSFTHGTLNSAGWDVEAKKWTSREKHLMGVIGVNKQVRDEAAEILYGTNRFIFEDPQTFSLLAKLSDSRLQHLRRLDLCSPQGNKGNHLSAALNLLKQGTSLRALALPHEAICTSLAPPYRQRSAESMSADALVEACAPLLYALEQARQQT